MSARHEPEPARIKRLLDGLVAARERRDGERRWSDRWLALDAEMHAIERAVFRMPIEEEPEDRQLDRAG
jgi:hypothetical protein